jgi:hypothetical protein
VEALREENIVKVNIIAYYIDYDSSNNHFQMRHRIRRIEFAGLERARVRRQRKRRRFGDLRDTQIESEDEIQIPHQDVLQKQSRTVLLADRFAVRVRNYQYGITISNENVKI